MEQVNLNCLHSWTVVQTVFNDYRICNIVRKKITEPIISFNEKNNLFERDEIVSYCDEGLTDKQDFIKIYFQTPSNRKYQQIVCTRNCFLMTQLGWKKAYELNENDKLLGYCENQLSNDQEQILLGTLLGDGFLQKSTIKASLRLENSEQPEYLKWKIEKLSCFNFKSLKQNRFDSEYEFILKKKYDLFYENETSKILKQKTGRQYRAFCNEIFEKIDILALAVFYLDDGSLIDNKVYIGSKRFRHLNNVYFFEEILKCFKRFGLYGKILNNEFSIILDEQSSLKFSKVISKFVVPEMNYKLLECHRNNYCNDFINIQKEIKFEKFFVNILKIAPIKKEVKTLRKFRLMTNNKTYLIGSARNFSGVVVKC